jgi:hypothetical protein
VTKVLFAYLSSFSSLALSHVALGIAIRSQGVWVSKGQFVAGALQQN